MKHIVFNKLVYELTDSIWDELKSREQEFVIAQAKETEDDPYYGADYASNFYNMLEWIERSCPCLTTEKDNYDLHRYDGLINSGEPLPF